MSKDNDLVWEELSRETVWEKYGRSMEKVMFALPDGQVGDYYVKNEGHPVCVLPITNEGKVVLSKEFRPGPKKVLWELPGGRIADGEEPLAAAQRELLEETGYQGQLTLVTRCYDCAYAMTHRYCFVATQCEKVAEPNPDATEFLEVVTVSVDEFRSILRSGNMTDVEVGYLGLDYLNLL